MNIVFLYSRYAVYLEGTLRALIDSTEDVHIDVVYWDQSRLLPFIVGEVENISFHRRSCLSVIELHDLLVRTRPDILYISGWMDRGYILAAMKYKRKYTNVRIVVGIDDQWHNSIRQCLGILVFKLKFSKLFDYMWVSGKPQYHYARRMGYENERIISNLYSANTYLFRDRALFSRRIVFLGRFAPEKGILNLLTEYDKLPNNTKQEWPLILIGDGPLKEEIITRESKYVTIIPFLQSSKLLDELKKGGVFCLPSIREPWGVVVHELAILGYPLLLSSECGANTEFLLNGYNGFSFNPTKKDSILNALLRITSLSQDELELFSTRSHLLGQRISSEITAASLLSISPEYTASITTAGRV